MTWLRRTSEERSSTFVPILAFAAIAGSALGVLAAVTVTVPVVERVDPARPAERRALSEKLAAVDAALARRDIGRAMFDWREAHALALGERRWDAMTAVGDAALRIDAVASRDAGTPTAFRGEARQAYLKALFRARTERSRDGIVRVADAFAALGDTEMAARARALDVVR